VNQLILYIQNNTIKKFQKIADVTVVWSQQNSRIKQEAQLPLRNRASATYIFLAKLISIVYSCL